MTASGVCKVAKDKALHIIKERIAIEKTKAYFAYSHVNNFPVYQFDTEGVGSVDIPVSELNWCKLREVAIKTATEGKDDANENSAWTINGLKIKSAGSSTYPAVLQQFLYKVLNPMIMDLDVSTIKARLTSLILCKAGETHKSSHLSSDNADHLVKLLLQLPVINTIDNGRLKVSHGNRTIDFTVGGIYKGTAAAFVFYPECSYHLESIKTGHRILLEFDLFQPEIAVPKHLSAFRHHSNMLQHVLAGIFQLPTAVRPDALLFPLDHKYGQRNAFLKAMKGRDAVVTRIFNSSSDLHVHLALLTKDPGQTADIGEFCSLPNRNRRAYHLVSGSQDISQLAMWVAFEKSPISFEIFEDAPSSSMIQRIDPPPVDTQVPQFSENALFAAALVIWPKGSTEEIQGKFRSLGDWHQLRQLTGSPLLVVEGTKIEMDSILASIRNNMQCLTEGNTLRVFQSICLKNRFHSTILDLLQAVAEYPKWPNPSVPCSLIAEAIGISQEFSPPLDQIDEFFHRLSNVDIWAKIGFCSAVADTMKERRMVAPFVKLAHLTLQLFLNAQKAALRRTRCSYSLALYMFCHMVMALENLRPNAIESRVLSALRPHCRSLTIDDLVRLTIQIPCEYPTFFHSDPCKHIYRLMWCSLRIRDYSCEHFLSMNSTNVVKCFQGLLLLRDPILTDWFSSKMASLILSADASNPLLTFILSSDIVSELKTTDHGKQALEVLEAVKVIVLNRRRQPIFTWEKPNAVVADHPEVQNFLRSAERAFCYSNFRNVADARVFARKLEAMQRKADSKFSLTATPGGKEGEAFCHIVKTCGRFLTSPAETLTEVGKEQKNIINSSRKSELLAVESAGSSSVPAKRAKLDEKKIPDESIKAVATLKSVSSVGPNVASNNAVASIAKPLQKKVPDEFSRTVVTVAKTSLAKEWVLPQVKTIEGAYNKWFRENENKASSLVIKALFQNLVDGKINVKELSRGFEKEFLGQKLPCSRALQKFLPEVKHALQTEKVSILGIKPPIPKRATDVANETSRSEEKVLTIAATSDVNTSDDDSSPIITAVVKKEPLVIDLTD